MTNRVVVTGIGVVSPIGVGLAEAARGLREGRTGVQAHPEWASVAHLKTRLGAVVPDLGAAAVPRKAARTMGRVAQLATVATTEAIRDAGLTPAELGSGTVGLAYGSTHGSTTATEEFTRHFFSRGLEGLSATGYLKFMSHTAAANLAMHFGIKGRVVPVVSACTSASQSIGVAYEAVKHGLSEVMLAGGAEELHVLHAAVFDLLYATSTRSNEDPSSSPRPFDRDRDGMVVGEGAGTLVLEPLERARARGARIHAELVGFGTTCDGAHVTSPSPEGMAAAIRAALKDAGLPADAIGYVNAHGTGTELGDLAESQATNAVLGARVPFSSTKGATGHTLGACGAIEAALSLVMLHEGFAAPTRNLVNVDPRCAPLDHVQGGLRRIALEHVMSNNFAFGGIDTSLIFRRL